MYFTAPVGTQCASVSASVSQVRSQLTDVPLTCVKAMGAVMAPVRDGGPDFCQRADHHSLCWADGAL
eukprot:scaffold191941_cov13-Tisochrysis_lutea.AAC.1